MKITKIEGQLARFPLPREMRFVWAPEQVYRSLGITIVRIHTDEGISGIGASFQTFDVQVLATVRSLIAPVLIGRDPFATAEHYRIINGASLFGARAWLVDQALWDIIGKATGQPLYRLWGAAQQKLPTYAAPNEPRTAKETAELALKLREEGFRGIKLRLHAEQMKDDLNLVETVRKAVGDSMEIMVDANQATALTSAERAPIWDYRRALLTARALEHLGVFFLEEPLEIYDFDGIARLTQETAIHIAGGEWNSGAHEFRWMLERGAYDILQPDATQSEGMCQIRQIAEAAAARGKKIIPHVWGNGVALAANLQIGLSVSNCPYIEYPYDPISLPVEVNQWMLQEPLWIDGDGCLRAPTMPGLGIALNEEMIDRYTTHRM